MSCSFKPILFLNVFLVVLLNGPGFSQDRQERTKRVQPNGPTSRILFVRPRGMGIGWSTSGGQFVEDVLHVPAKYNFPRGATYRLKFSSIPGRKHLVLFPALEVYPATALTSRYLKQQMVPLEFSDQDLDLVESNCLVTKVLFLPASFRTGANIRASDIRELVSYEPPAASFTSVMSLSKFKKWQADRSRADTGPNESDRNAIAVRTRRMQLAVKKMIGTARTRAFDSPDAARKSLQRAVDVIRGTTDIDRSAKTELARRLSSLKRFVELSLAVDDLGKGQLEQLEPLERSWVQDLMAAHEKWPINRLRMRVRPENDPIELVEWGRGTILAVARIGLVNAERGLQRTVKHRPRSQFRFLRPSGASIGWTMGKQFSDRQMIVPTILNVQAGVSALTWKDIPGRPSQFVVFQRIHVFPPDPRSEIFLAHSPLPLEITDEDCDHIADGHVVTRVIFRPDRQHRELASVGVDSLVTTRLDPGVDPVTEAERRGTIMAVVHSSSRELDGVLKRR